MGSASSAPATRDRCLPSGWRGDREAPGPDVLDGARRREFARREQPARWSSSILPKLTLAPLVK